MGVGCSSSATTTSRSGWRGADVGFIRRFKLDFPDAVDIRLEENFRSTGHILAAANAIIAEDKARFGKTLFTRKGQGRRSSS